MKYLIVGLGNIGSEYDGTRHNIGFRVLDALAKASNLVFIPLERTLVVVDDLSLPFGALRMKPGGSDGGHNGLKHIASVLGTQEYARLRFGIGNDFPRGGQIDYVLGHFTDEDMKTMDERVALACEMVKSFCLCGIQITMNQYNKK